MEEMNNNENLNTENTVEQVVEKKSDNAIKFIIPIAVLIVLVLILVGVAAATGKLGGGNAKKKVADAITETFHRSSEKMKDSWGLDEYIDMFEDRQMSIEADLAVAGDGGLQMQYNMDDKIKSVYMDVSYWGTSIVQAVLYVDDEELSLGLPDLTDYVFFINRVTLEDDIQTLIDEGMLDEDTAEAFVTLNKETQDLEGKNEEIKQGAYDILNALKDIYYKAETKKADSKTLEINGENQNCKGYVTMITGQQISEFFLAYKEVYEENEAFCDYFNQLAASETGYISVEEFLADVNPADEFQNLADEAAESKDDYEIYFYLNEGVVAQIYCEIDEDNYLEWNIKGGNFPLENTEIVFVADGNENTFVRSGSIEDGVYRADYAFDILDEELNFEVEYNKNSGDIAVEIYDYYSDLTFNGNIDRSIPGSELKIEIDSVEMDQEEILYGDITISNECGEIEKPEGEKLDVMELTEDDWYDIIEEIIYGMY